MISRQSTFFYNFAVVQDCIDSAYETKDNRQKKEPVSHAKQNDPKPHLIEDLEDVCLGWG